MPSRMFDVEQIDLISSYVLSPQTNIYRIQHAFRQRNHLIRSAFKPDSILQYLLHL